MAASPCPSAADDPAQRVVTIRRDRYEQSRKVSPMPSGLSVPTSVGVLKSSMTVALGRVIPRGARRALGLLCLLCVVAPASAWAADYRCIVTVTYPNGRKTNTTVDVSPWFWQSAEGVAAGKAVPASLKNQLAGAKIDVYCWEIQKPKRWGFLPVVYTYPSDRLTGVTIAFEAPVNTGAASADLRQGAAAPKASMMDGLDVSAVGEVSITKADFGSALIFAGGGRVGRRLESGLEPFGQVVLGVTRFSGGGGSSFTLKPEGGVVIPTKGRPFDMTVSIGFPIIFFTGAHESGFQIAGGLVFPARTMNPPR
jgi:hypothetical protein